MDEFDFYFTTLLYDIYFFISLEQSSKSLDDFSNEGLNGRFLAKISGKNGEIMSAYDVPDELISKAEQMYRQKISEDKQKAKTEDFEYVEDDSQNPVQSINSEKTLNFQTEIANQVMIEYYKENYPPTTQQKLNEILKNYKTKNIYNLSQTNIQLGANRIIPVVNGKESVSDITLGAESSELALYFSRYSGVNDDLASSFLAKDYKIEPGQIPVIINYKTAENILGLNQLESTASEQEKYDRVQEIRSSVSKMSQKVCYRNYASQMLMQSAISANQNKYSNLRYNISEDPCGNPEISSDTRTVEEKNTENNLKEMQESLGTYEAPEAKELTLKIVGVMPNAPESYYYDNIQDFLKQITSSTLDSLSNSPIIPWQVFQESVDAETKRIFAQENEKYYLNEILSSGVSSIVEFDSSDEMRQFSEKYNCTKDYCGEISLDIQPFSNNSSVISDAKKYISNILGWAFFVVIIISIILIYSVINRVLADSRKETAVFRAIGYSRFEITQIYISYITIFSFICTIIISIISSVCIFTIKTFFEPQATLYFTNFFALEGVKYFRIVDFSPTVLLAFIIIFVIGLIAATIPLIINTRRSPLKNLRSE